MAESELYEKGIALRSELLGEDVVERMNQSTYDDNPIMQEFRDLVAETVFGSLWMRIPPFCKMTTAFNIVASA